MVTHSQQEIVSYIQRHLYEHGYAPTVRELCRVFRIRSAKDIQRQLRALERRGAIVRHRTTPRAVRVVWNEVVSVPAPVHPKVFRLHGCIILDLGVAGSLQLSRQRARQLARDLLAQSTNSTDST